jgi:superoxide dismutase, Fe-Mn family
MTRYLLPDLAYDYGALEPHISGQIMELHHDRHHRKYVEGANEANDKLQEARRRGDLAILGLLEKELAFHASGHVLHSIFWQNLSPHGGGLPEGALEADINRDFGSFDSFRHQMNRAAAEILGSGWSALLFDPVSRRLAIAQIHDHQSDTIQSAVPLLVLDAWEHAYYLQYQTEKQAYFDAIWNLWNWSDVAQRYALAQRLDLGLDDVTDEALVVLEGGERGARADEEGIRPDEEPDVRH